jgi:hypothetical protein
LLVEHLHLIDLPHEAEHVARAIVLAAALDGVDKAALAAVAQLPERALAETLLVHWHAEPEIVFLAPPKAPSTSPLWRKPTRCSKCT